MDKLKRWYPSLIVMAVIFLISSAPGAAIRAVGLGKESYHINGHFILFFFLCLSYFKATKKIALSIVLTGLYAGFDELHQTFTPMRSASMFDVSVDILGALLAAALLWKLSFLLPKKLKSWLIN